MSLNEDRAQRALDVLRYYDAQETVNNEMIGPMKDLVSDLFHLAYQNGFDLMNDVIFMAEDHFQVEINEEG